MNLRKNTLELQKKLMVEFKDIKTLETAITHSSYANERKLSFNERLEFLGDSVLQLVISEYLYSNTENETEGYLTKIRSLIVCENSLFQIAKGWNLGIYINMSKGEELTGGRTRVSILADAVEAIIAAIYLDRGYEVAKTFILNNFNNIIEKAFKNEIIIDYKTKLQENLQSHGEVSIVYNLIKFEGPPHRREFFVEVVVNGVSSGKGVGYSKKEAEQNAAKELLITRGEIHE
ncbi:ribonuclease III [Clostridium sp. UBA4548]|uniref:ribonuclease III n=1 Tax=Clostridium sp. UBA4548 TaxID=1946361 RepID=UPI0025C738BA|nr:ribonuclease III [Clostridium sp. UBA4548]